MNNKKICQFESCGKKLSITELMTCKCKCGNTYCVLHRLSESHNCKYNFKGDINVEDYIVKNKCNSNKLKELW
jgi:hypothetical protein